MCVHSTLVLALHMFTTLYILYGCRLSAGATMLPVVRVEKKEGGVSETTQAHVSTRDGQVTGYRSRPSRCPVVLCFEGHNG